MGREASRRQIHFGLAVMEREMADVCALHDWALDQWCAEEDPQVESGDGLQSLILDQHFCNFKVWDLEDEARRTDVGDSVIVGVKRAIDRFNQQRSDLLEAIDDLLLEHFQGADLSRADQHSETAGQIVDRLSILSLKIRHISAYAAQASIPALAAECTGKVALLRTQRRDLADCLAQLLTDFRAGRRFFKSYRQFKAYNDARLNPALSRAAKEK